MIRQFSDLIQLSKEYDDSAELTKSMTEGASLKEGISKIEFPKVALSDNQMNILFKDNTNSLMRQTIDQSTGSLSKYAREIIQANTDFLFFLEFLDLNNPKKYDQISSEKVDSLSYFLYVQQMFDSVSMIPNDMNEEQSALSEIIKYVVLHTKSLSSVDNISSFNKEIAKILKKVHDSNNDLFDPVFEDCYSKSFIHKNRINKDTLKNVSKRLLEQSGADESIVNKYVNEGEKYYTLLSTVSSLIYYKNYLKHDEKSTFYPYGEILNEAKSKTSFLIDSIGKLLSNGKTTSGIYVLKLSVNWEKVFQGTRLSNASFIEITYQNSKKTYEINENDESYVEIVLPSFSKDTDTVDISLVYVKEKYNDTIRKDVPEEGIGILVSFTYSLKNENNAKQSSKSKSRPSSMMMDNDNLIVEFKRGDTELSKKCGTIKVSSKFYDFKDDGTPELLQSNIYTKADGYSDNFQMKEFLDFLVSNFINQWMLVSTQSGSTSVSIYPPQEAYIGLIEFAMRYSIPASTLYLQISKKLLEAWCHSESYLNAFTTVFITAHVCMMNNKKKNNKLYLNKEEEELYDSIYKFLEKNVPVYLVQHIYRAGLYQNHGLVPLFMLLSFVIPEEKIDSYVEQLVQASSKNTVCSIANYLKPTILEGNEVNSDKMTKEVSNLLEFINNKKNNNNFDNLMKNDNDFDFSSAEPSKITFTIKSLSETIDILNKRTQQLNKFYEHYSLPAFLSNQWESIEDDLCQFALILVKLFLLILDEKFGDDQSIFKFIFSYRELHNFFMKIMQQNKKKSSDDNEITSEEYSPFKIFFNVINNWLSRIGGQMSIWITNAVDIDTFEIDDKKLKTSSSPKDMFEVFRQSFNFLYSLHWEDPSLEIFISTFLSLCGSCLRDFIETLTLRMLSYFPVEVLEESQIEAILQHIDNLQPEQKNKPKKDKKKAKDKVKEKQQKDMEKGSDGKTKITTRSIFVIINDFLNLRSMWNGFLVHAKKMFPSLFPEQQDGKNHKPMSLSSANNSSAMLNSSNVIELPPHVMDPVPKLTPITNSIPTLFSLYTSHLVTDTVSPHLWVKNTTVKQIFVKNASKFVLNPEFFKTCSPIYASIFDTILNYIKDRIDDINATTCMKYYKTMIISFLFGLDSGMMNLLVRNKKKSWPIKNKRLVPILNFIQDLFKEVYQYVNETSIENIFAADENLESYTPHSIFMLNHVHDDPEQLIDLVSKNCSQEIIDASNEQDPQFLNALCIYIIVASQTNDKRSNVINWVQDNKIHFKKKRFYPPKYK